MSCAKLSHGMFTALALCVLVSVLYLSFVAHAMTFAVIGDFGTGGRAAGAQTEMRTAMALNNVCDRIKCNFTISVGDNIYVGDVMKGLHDSFEDMYTSPGPFFPSIGNHDNWGPQVEYAKKNKRWRFDSRWYSYKLPIDNTGYTVHVFVVDATDGSLGGGGQLTWLENELKNTDSRWKLIVGHYPTLGSGRHRRVGTVGRIPQLMEKYGAQAYFCGHDHILEVSNDGGRVMGLSGAMARGGMMFRGLGGATRKFTLTSPGEHNQYRQDWPIHGFLTGTLSPNVLTMQAWSLYEGLQYEFSVTWDWLTVGKNNVAAAKRGDWPQGDVVAAAFRDEMTLPVGPGGGVLWDADGHIIVGSAAPTVKTPAPTTPVPTTLAPGATAAPPTPVPPTPAPTDAPINHIDLNVPAADRPRDAADIPSYLRYAVTTECSGCDGPTAQQPFTVFFAGDTATPSWRVFLSLSVLGCAQKKMPFLVEGTETVTPKGNAVRFVATAPSSAVYVCVSRDKGENFGRLERADTEFQQFSFVLRPALPNVTQSAEVGPVFGNPGTGTTVNPTGTNNGQGANVPQFGQSERSNGKLVVIGVVCVAIGAIGAFLAGQLRSRERRGAAAVPPPSATAPASGTVD